LVACLAAGMERRYQPRSSFLRTVRAARNKAWAGPMRPSSLPVFANILEISIIKEVEGLILEAHAERITRETREKVTQKKY
jgi:hypothetical protein